MHWQFYITEISVETSQLSAVADEHQASPLALLLDYGGLFNIDTSKDISPYSGQTITIYESDDFYDPTTKYHLKETIIF